MIVMATILPSSPAPRHLDRLENLRPSPAKADLNNLDPGWRARVGAAIARAFQLAGLSQKEAAAAVGHDQAQVARWLSGQERPQFDALFAVEALRAPLVIALAALAEDIDVTTTITIRRSA